MKLQYQKEKIANFSKVVFSQNFQQYYGMTNTFKSFEEQNLTNEIKISLLKKLSVTNHLTVPSFEKFWEWIRKKHGTELSIMLAKFIYPNDDANCTGMKNCMRGNRNHSLWMHIKARVYKKWCSIVTEMQCVYAVVKGIHDKGMNWEVLVSPELDAIGVDFAIIVPFENGNKVFPIQIKKDSFNPYAQNKYNALDNFDKVPVKKKQEIELNKELTKQKINGEIQEMTILKYGVTSKGDLPYSYLKRYTNGFIYYDSKILISELEKNLF